MYEDKSQRAGRPENWMPNYSSSEPNILPVLELMRWLRLQATHATASQAAWDAELANGLNPYALLAEREAI
jgi:hypothetical protein